MDSLLGAYDTIVDTLRGGHQYTLRQEPSSETAVRLVKRIVTFVVYYFANYILISLNQFASFPGWVVGIACRKQIHNFINHIKQDGCINDTTTRILIFIAGLTICSLAMTQTIPIFCFSVSVLSGAMLHDAYTKDYIPFISTQSPPPTPHRHFHAT